jgi:YVTN family beta-propeller protein
VHVSANGELLYVGVHLLDAIAVFDLADGAEKRRMAAGNGPQFFTRQTPAGLLYASNLLSNRLGTRESPVNEITVIDSVAGRPVQRIQLEGANVGRQIAVAPDGSLGIVPVSRPKNLLPMTQLARGGVVTYGVAVFFPGSSRAPVQLLIDQPQQFYADPFGATFTPDGRLLYLTASGADQLIVIDTASLKQVLEEVQAGKWPSAENHLGLSRRFVIRRVPLGSQPMGLTCTADGRWLYAANRLSDSISVIDVATQTVHRTILLDRPGDSQPATSAPVVEGRIRQGERLFHSAAASFQGQLSCASCHPDGGIDSLTYDLQPDGLGQNIVDNRTLAGIAGTAPFKWTGTNPDLTTQCGARAAKWILRTGGLRASELVALADYMRSRNPQPNPYRNSDGSLTKEQRRGKQLYEREFSNQGRRLAENERCITCHPLPLGTNKRKFDVGTATATDTIKVFDTPHLTNIFESAPYLHDGRCRTLEELWTVYNPDDAHGFASDLTKQQLNDLIEYLKTL